MNKSIIMFTLLLFVNLLPSHADLTALNFSPKFLNDNATFVAGNVTKTLAGDESFLDLEALAGVGNDDLMSIQLIGANQNVSSVDITLDIENATPGGDNDLIIYLTDGVNFIGLQRADNGGGRLEIFNSNPPGANVSGSLFTSFNSLFQFNVDMTASSLTATGEMSSQSLVGNSSNFLNPDNALSLIINGNSAGEIFRVKSISVEITSDPAVPEPTSIVLLSLAIFGFVGYRRR